MDKSQQLAEALVKSFPALKEAAEASDTQPIEDWFDFLEYGMDGMFGKAAEHAAGFILNVVKAQEHAGLFDIRAALLEWDDIHFMSFLMVCFNLRKAAFTTDLHKHVNVCHDLWSDENDWREQH